LWRFGDDPRRSNLAQLAKWYGTDAETLVRLPYKVVGNAFLRVFRGATGDDCKLARNAIIIPARDASGSIRGLCDSEDNWVSPRTPHVANPKRAFSGVHLVEWIIEADLLAQELSCCAVSLNGFDESALWTLFPHLGTINILSRPRRAMAA
jgi:hypothetical protein